MGKFYVCSYEESGDSLAFTLTKEVLKPEKTVVSRGAVLDNGYAAASAVFFQNAPIVLLDETLNVVKAFGRLAGQSESGTDMRTYEGMVSSYGNSFVYGMKRFGYLSFYSQKDTVVQKEWEIYLEEPLYSGEVLKCKDLKRGFVDVKMTKNYVIGSYCGRLASPKKDRGLFGYHILVFDHQGNLVRNLKLDRKIGRIAVSENEKNIYAVAYEPDICIVRYTLED